MSQREAASHFWISRGSIQMTLAYSLPPDYRCEASIKRPTLDDFAEITDTWLEEDRDVPRKRVSSGDLEQPR